MSYSIGQVVYVIPKAEQRVVPVQVIKIITEQELNSDNKVSYVVNTGNASVRLEALANEVFDNAVHARKVLVERATVAINKMVATAQQQELELFPRSETTPEPVTTSATNPESTEASIVELPDGTKARVKKIKIPDALKG